jgi:hypothetical protein
MKRQRIELSPFVDCRQTPKLTLEFVARPPGRDDAARQSGTKIADISKKSPCTLRFWDKHLERRETPQTKRDE